MQKEKKKMCMALCANPRSKKHAALNLQSQAVIRTVLRSRYQWNGWPLDMNNYSDIQLSERNSCKLATHVGAPWTPLSKCGTLLFSADKRQSGCLLLFFFFLRGARSHMLFSDFAGFFYWPQKWERNQCVVENGAVGCRSNLLTYV